MDEKEEIFQSVLLQRGHAGMFIPVSIISFVVFVSFVVLLRMGFRV